MKNVFVTFVISVLFLFLGGSVDIIAATTATDNNETFMTATPIKSDTAVKGMIDDFEDVDWYKHTIDKTSGFQIKFTNLADQEGEWNIKIYDSNVRLIKDYAIESNYTDITLPYAYAKGEDIYFVVAQRDNLSVGKQYQIEILYLTDFEWEKENNDDRENATKLESTKPLYGVINDSQSVADSDWYVYTVKNNDPFYFEITNTATRNTTWNLEVYDNNFTKLMAREFPYSNYIFDTEKYEGFKKGDKVYVHIYRRDNNVGIIYELKVVDGDTDKKSDNVNVISILAGTNVVVGQADAGAKVSVKYGKKTYTTTADSDGFYRVKTAKLKKGKSVTIWQTVNKKDSKKTTVKVVNKY